MLYHKMEERTFYVLHISPKLSAVQITINNDKHLKAKVVIAFSDL
jgi:hypothetical protein